jgi:hypothetical protein
MPSRFTAQPAPGGEASRKGPPQGNASMRFKRSVTPATERVAHARPEPLLRPDRRFRCPVLHPVGTPAQRGLAHGPAPAFHALFSFPQGGWEAVRESTPDFALRLLELVDLPYEDIRGTQEGLWRESVDCFTPLTKTRSWLGRPPGYLDLARNYGGVLEPLLFPKILNDS